MSNDPLMQVGSPNTATPVVNTATPVATAATPVVEDSSAQVDKIAYLLFIIISCVSVMVILGPVLIPLVTAIFLFFVIRPTTIKLERNNIPRWITYLFLIVSIVGVSGAMTALTVQDVRRLSTLYPQMETKAEAILKKIPGIGKNPLSSETLESVFSVQPSEILQHSFGTAWHFSEMILLVIFYFVFILLDADKMPRRIQTAFPKQGPNLVRVFGKISEGISRFIRIKTLVSFGMAISVAVILMSFGVSNWLLWACLTFLLNYITYIGSMFALVPPIVMSALEFNQFWPWVGLVTLLVLNRFIWIDYIEIRYTGQQLRINNALLLFSIVFWGWFWGITGMVLAVPMLSALRIIMAQFPQTRSWAMMISED
ncbi:AI-2E family transporter [Planctomicrobium sp. SH668]|uniref:AI-2E family transporter n=1 Tax=Planctomicrobium sp. SH668 TaxID=3448126 RepID=UPI003F5BBC36